MAHRREFVLNGNKATLHIEQGGINIYCNDNYVFSYDAQSGYVEISPEFAKYVPQIKTMLQQLRTTDGQIELAGYIKKMTRQAEKVLGK